MIQGSTLFFNINCVFTLKWNENGPYSSQQSGPRRKEQQYDTRYLILCDSCSYSKQPTMVSSVALVSIRVERSLCNGGRTWDVQNSLLTRALVTKQLAHSCSYISAVYRAYN